ncbi:MAG: acyl-CoA dehydrogenase, partial [Bacteroidota bacterium]
KFKKAILMVAGSAVQKLAMSLAKEQEILMNIADMAIQAYAAESTLLRIKKLEGIKGADAIEVEKDMMRVFIYEAAEKINSAGKEALMSFAEGDELRMMLMGMKRFTKTEPFNIKACRQNVAQKVIEANKYCF